MVLAFTCVCEHVCIPLIIKNKTSLEETNKKKVGLYTSGKSHFVDRGAITSKTWPARIKGILNPHHRAFSGHKGTSPFED